MVKQIRYRQSDAILNMFERKEVRRDEEALPNR